MGVCRHFALLCPFHSTQTLVGRTTKVSWWGAVADQESTPIKDRPSQPIQTASAPLPSTNFRSQTLSIPVPEHIRGAFASFPVSGLRTSCILCCCFQVGFMYLFLCIRICMLVSPLSMRCVVVAMVPF